MQTVGLSPQVPVLLPVRQLGPDRVAALLMDDLGDELRRRHVDYVERTEPGAPDGPVDVSVDALRNKRVKLCLKLLCTCALRQLLGSCSLHYSSLVLTSFPIMSKMRRTHLAYDVTHFKYPKI